MKGIFWRIRAKGMHEEERKVFVNCKDASRMNIHCRTVAEEKCFGGGEIVVFS